MTGARIITALAVLAAGTVADARFGADARIVTDMGGGAPRARPYLQCVPYARQVSGIAIYGDAHTWWGQAEGRYARGSEPRVGAVMAFRPHASSRLGHVAAVSRIVDDRTVLIKHANWSERGRIENNVRAVDVSPAGDWSRVRVWYSPIHALGGTAWPVRGFIYNEAPGRSRNERPARGRDTERATPARHRPARDLPAGRSDPIGDIIAGED